MKPSSDIEISDVTLPIAALLIASVFEELDGSRIENSPSGGRRLGRVGKLAPPTSASGEEGLPGSRRRGRTGGAPSMRGLLIVGASGWKREKKNHGHRTARYQHEPNGNQRREPGRKRELQGRSENYGPNQGLALRVELVLDLLFGLGDFLPRLLDFSTELLVLVLLPLIDPLSC
jgi:hypothetical protein